MILCPIYHTRLAAYLQRSAGVGGDGARLQKELLVTGPIFPKILQDSIEKEF